MDGPTFFALLKIELVDSFKLVDECSNNLSRLSVSPNNYWWSDSSKENSGSFQLGLERVPGSAHRLIMRSNTWNNPILKIYHAFLMC